MQLRFSRFVSLLLLFCGLVLAADRPKPAPPETPRIAVTETLHGQTITDPYRWLEDQDAPQTRAWIDAQNAYTQSFLGELPMRAAIRKRLTELMKVEQISIPTERGGRYFFSRRGAEQDLSVLHLKQGLNGGDEILIDPHPLSPDHTTSVNFAALSEDGNTLLYGVRLGGADEIEVHSYNIAKRTESNDRLTRARYNGLSLTPNGDTLYYGILTSAGPRLRVHRMGTTQSDDKEIFGEGYGREASVSPRVTPDGRWLIIHVAHGSSGDDGELYFQDLKSGGPIQTIVKGEHARFFAQAAGNTLMVETNLDAPNGRVLAIDLEHPARDQWKQVVPESDSSIESTAVVGGKILVEYLRNATSQVKIFTPDGKPAGELPLGTLGSISAFSGRWSSPEVFYRFISFAEPGVTYRYDLRTGKRTEWARTRVPLDPSKFEVKQVWYESKDKTRIPMFLVYAKGTKLDGARPTLLTGYGGFNVSETPRFSAEAVIFAENGGIFALPNLRGGGEFGEKWHRAGMLANKQNVFDDFIGAAEYLIKSGYTSREKLAISGGSNGGLLVGAALTQRPDLYRAVVCSYPLLDMVRYQNFLVARYWVSEYGSSENPEQLSYILKYSPYQNVKQGTQYPAVLFVTGDGDTRVAPLHARKMTALMQWAQGGDKPILLHYDTKAGHSQGRSISKVIEDNADEYSFVFWQLGVGEKAASAGK